ncbi:DNA/RNA helicase domain-containing protein [Deinococcus sp. A31D244]|uniref:DNA/RNA helicase domain-containing protein n=1 Tax=Deinococcus sp. A31D244 TaxID=3397675 RepID=UPI0039E0EF6B
MRLFSGDSALFIEKALNNEMATTLTTNFRTYFGHTPSDSEVKSWTLSLKDLAYSVQKAKVSDASVIIEYRLPLTSKRLDVMLLGKGQDKRDRGVIIELKQWEKAVSSGVEDCVKFGTKDTRLHLHPSRQAAGYAEYLRSVHTAFYNDQSGSEEFIDLQACSFLHNANDKKCGDLLALEFAQALKDAPLFTGNQRAAFEAYLSEQVGRGEGPAILQRVIDSRYAPSKKLLNHVADMIGGNSVFELLDEQRVAYNLIVSKIQEMRVTAHKAVIVIKGGPGTGKSVIAVKALGDLARDGVSVAHATGSKAFTTNLRAQVGRQASGVFRYFNSFMQEPADTIDVLVCDEAHRIRKTSNSRFTKAANRSDKDQVTELIDVAKVSVFLLDDHQMVRPDEVGTPQLIQEAAEKRGAEYFEVTLESQFRCAGSDSYLEWLDSAFGLRDQPATPELGWREDYAFKVFDSPAEMEAKLQEQVDAGYNARMVAGFCWKWSDPDAANQLLPDVVIGNWARPWNRKERGSEPPSKHPYTLWATEPAGFNEIGCIYSAQGFEFDYCGVIVGDDLVWRDGVWVAQKTASQDSAVKKTKPERLPELLAHTYRVLLSRGMRGTYVYFTDPETRRHVEDLLSPN